MSDTQIVSLVVALMPVIVALAGVLYQHLLSGLPAAKRGQVETVVSQAVHAVEQLAGSEMNGPAKKSAAVTMIEGVLKSLHLKADPTLIDMLIEEGVYYLNQSQPQDQQDQASPVGFMPPTVGA